MSLLLYKKRTHIVFVSNQMWCEWRESVRIFTQKSALKRQNRRDLIFITAIRVVKNKNYSVMSNYHLQDKNLSFKAKGLLSYMLSLPDNWKYTIKGIAKESKESEKTVRTVLKELETKKYLVIVKKQNTLGRFVYEYFVYEKPDTQNP